MEQRISLVTLGVADIERSVKFYTEALGWKAAPSPPEIRFFDMGGIVFSIYRHEDLAKDRNAGANETGSSYKGFALAHNARSEAEVDSLFAQLKAAGVTIAKPPERAFWGGYSGYFTDPDGHSWEVAYNPFWPIDAQGRVSLPSG